MFEALFVIATCCVYAFLIWKFGIKRLWKMVKQLAHRLVDGPPESKTCMHLHLTAKAEWEVYGEVKSESVRDHLKTCTLRIADMPFGKPLSTPRANCNHSRTIVEEYNLDGTVAVRYCSVCGGTPVPVTPRLPNPGRVERR